MPSSKLPLTVRVSVSVVHRGALVEVVDEIEFTGNVGLVEDAAVNVYTKLHRFVTAPGGKAG